MFFEQNKSDIQRDLDYSIKTGLHQIKILTLLRNNLPKFSKTFKTSIATQDVNINLENYISTELTFFLNNKVNQSGYLFQFQATGPDIFARQFGDGVHGLKLLFIEAKRLPSTSSQDYVKTGIGKFKKEEHGKQHDIAAMLGYVQEKNFNHWHNEVNSWIMALVPDENENPRWIKEEQINKVQITDIGEYQSTHCRITEEPITLHHFWINLCNHKN
ncbi:MAG: hypothetical protein ACYSSI_13035 [Planctomycetota bacterium]|jgi:hypothetical protein